MKAGFHVILRSAAWLRSAPNFSNEDNTSQRQAHRAAKHGTLMGYRRKLTCSPGSPDTTSAPPPGWRFHRCCHSWGYGFAPLASDSKRSRSYYLLNFRCFFTQSPFFPNHISLPHFTEAKILWRWSFLIWPQVSPEGLHPLSALPDLVHRHWRGHQLWAVSHWEPCRVTRDGAW